MANDVIKLSPDLMGKCATNYATLASNIITIANEIDAQYSQVSSVLQGGAGAKFLSAYSEIRQGILEVASKVESTSKYLNYVVANYVNADNSYQDIDIEDYGKVLTYMNETMERVKKNITNNNKDEEEKPPVSM